MRNTTTKSTLNWIAKVHNRLLKHVQQETTDLAASPAIQSKRAGDVYFSSSRDRVVTEAAPSFIVPSCLLPRGHVVVAKLPPTQSSILVYRDPVTNTVRAYKNQCRHRGAELLAPESAPVTGPRRLTGSPLVVCPYHSWTYHIGTGQLKRVPGEADGFPCLDKDRWGLQALPCQERVGGIWVGGDESLVDDFSLTEMDDELRHLWLDPPTISTTTTSSIDTTTTNSTSLLVGYREWNIPANWQLLVETFLESYHVQYLHRSTLGQVTHGNRMVSDYYMNSRSLRQTVPLTNLDPTPIEEEDGSLEISPMHSFFSQTTTTCFAFPNVAISLFKRFALMLSIIPTSNTSSHIQAFGITHTTAKGNDVSIQHQQRDFESVLVGIEEDWECAAGIQRGLTPDTMIHHGRFEGNNHYFLHNVGEIADKLNNRQDGAQGSN
jgi:phenylpropionate dioxygenase-like ring-hydroxylating dioxygenase large terminal subunit